MNNGPDTLLSERILLTIHQHDRRFGHFEIADAISAVTVEERYQCLNNLRLLEKSWLIRSKTSDGAVRFWIVGPSDLPRPASKP
jgi:hypothetical protein